MKRSYNHDYFPPTPVLQIRFSAPECELRAEALQAIVDTGVGGTLVPIEHPQKIGASVEGHSGLRSQWGERRPANLYLVDG